VIWIESGRQRNDARFNESQCCDEQGVSTEPTSTLRKRGKKGFSNAS
jgi:hypothetical protein